MGTLSRDDNGKKVQLRYSPLGFLSSLSSVGFGYKTFDNADWSSWFCQVIGMPLPALVPVRDRICACGRHHFDAHGDHIHTCRGHEGRLAHSDRVAPTSPLHQQI